MPYFAVTRERGPSWDWSKALEGQDGWDVHAEFMEALVDEGLIVLGGPLSDGERVLFCMEAEGPDAIRARLDEDPWTPTQQLVVASIEPWEIRLDSRRRYSQRK
jgi:uncharacterized protein YciI